MSGLRDSKRKRWVAQEELAALNSGGVQSSQPHNEGSKMYEPMSKVRASADLTMDLQVLIGWAAAYRASHSLSPTYRKLAAAAAPATVTGVLGAFNSLMVRYSKEGVTQDNFLWSMGYHLLPGNFVCESVMEVLRKFAEGNAFEYPAEEDTKRFRDDRNKNAVAFHAADRQIKALDPSARPLKEQFIAPPSLSHELATCAEFMATLVPSLAYLGYAAHAHINPPGVAGHNPAVGGAARALGMGKAVLTVIPPTRAWLQLTGDTAAALTAALHVSVRAGAESDQTAAAANTVEEDPDSD